MAKHTYIFYLKSNAIRVNEVGTNNSLQDIEVRGFKKYEYKSKDDFEVFFEALKDDNGIENFEDSNIFILHWNVDKETLEKFQSHIANSPSVMALNCETSRVLTENINDDENEKLKKELEEKENEIKSLNEKIEDENNAHEKEIEELKNQHETKAKELENAIAEKDKRLADLEPKRSIVRATGKGLISWEIETFNKNNSDRPFHFRTFGSDSSSFFVTFGHFPTGISERAWIAVIRKSTDRNYWGNAYVVEAGQQGFLYRIADEMSEVKEGEVVAVMSSIPNDAGVNQWLEENGVKGKTAQYVGGNEYNQEEDDESNIL